jgi:sodium-dependent phosphate cotransporter
LERLVYQGNKEEFRRAFAGATVHDMFNWLSVLVLLPLELVSGYLERVTKLLVDVMLKANLDAKEPEMLSALTKPFTNVIIQLDKKVLEAIANKNASEDAQILKHVCGFDQKLNQTILFKLKINLLIILLH